MAKNHITNQTIWGMDFAAQERRQAIAKIPKMRVGKDRNIAPGLSSSQAWGNDVSGMDSRSVKRSLRGFGGARVLWWKIASRVLLAFNRGSMEHAMYQFHRSHHAVTFYLLDIQREFRSMLDAVSSVIATIRSGQRVAKM